ncbi:MAG: PIN domain-containing protein [Cyanobacteria bacterium J06627_3]
MNGLDTNVLVRYLIQDDTAQLQQVLNYLRKAASNNETCFVSNIVLCETVWVLKSTFSKRFTVF